MRFLLILAALLMLGCEGPAGAVGPEGPEGRTGEPGAPGVITSSTHTFTYTRHDLYVEDGVASVSFVLPEITEAVYEKGAVWAYLEWSGGWTSLPFPIKRTEPRVDASIAYRPGEITLLFLMEYDNFNDTRTSITDGRVRVVVSGI